MQQLDALCRSESKTQGVVVGAGVVITGLWMRGGRGEAFGDAPSGLGAADGGVSPDAVDFEEAAKGPDDGGEQVDGEGDGQQTGGDDGVALGFGLGPQHAGDEFGADLGFGAGDGGGVDEDHFREADGAVRGGVFVDAVVGVGVRLRVAAFVVGAGDAVEEVDVGALGQVHGVADAFGHFALDAFPARRLGGAGFGRAHLFLPFALHFVHFAFFFAFGGFGEGRGRRRVDQEPFGDAGGVEAVDLRLGEGDEVGDEFVRVAGVVDGVGDIVVAVALVRVLAIRRWMGVVALRPKLRVIAGLVRPRLLRGWGNRECAVSPFLWRMVVGALWLTRRNRRRSRVVGRSPAHLLRRWRKCRC